MAASVGTLNSGMEPIETAVKQRATIDYIAPFICLAVGLACLVFVIGPSDGTWILYAREMQAGHRLYSDLALNQQPLFPLISLAGIMLSPGGILGDKIIFLPVLGLHVALVFLISRRIAGSGLPCVALTLATYFTAIHFEAFRFDDYHAISQCFILGSLYLSLRYLDGELNAELFALIQGGLAAGAFLTRVNDGLAIAGAVAVVLLASLGISRATGRLFLVCSVGALPVFALVLLLVGDSPSTWFNQTLLVASQAKGGSSLAAAPGRAFISALKLLLVPTGIISAVVILVAAFAMFAWRPKSDRGALFVGMVVAVIVLLALTISYPPDPLSALAAFALIVSALAVLFWAIRWKATAFRGSADPTGRTLSLMSYPLSAFLTGALSTGGEVYLLYFPLALAMLIGVLIMRKAGLDEYRPSVQMAAYFFLYLIGLQGLAYRIANPFSWQSYRLKPLFVGYLAENDRLHGPHLITPELRNLVMPVCARVPQGATLLSLPFSFANYYCGIPVWKGFVQTFFDTTTKSRIDQLERELEKAPPDFIFYQRQLPVLRLHEILFAGGARLPQRDLDELIARKVRSGEWTIAYRSRAYPPSTWYLIRTSKA